VERTNDDRPEVEPAEYLAEKIDPSEVRRALQSLRRLRASLRSATLRADVGVALDRVSRIRFVDPPTPSGRAAG